MNIIPVGGVSQDNAERWLASGAGAIGLGNSLYESKDSLNMVKSKIIALNEALIAQVKIK